MFSLIKICFTLAIRVFAGFHLNGFSMKTECSAGNGQWTGTISIDSDLEQ